MEVMEILQQPELQLLAAAAGITEWYGATAGQPLTEQETMYWLHELIRRGVLSGGEGKFRFCEPYRTIFRTIKTADRLLAVTGNAQEMQNVCLYCGEKLVTLEESRQDADAVRIGVYEWEALHGLLEERGFLPEPYVEPDIAGLQPEEEFTEMLSEQVKQLLVQPDRFDFSTEKEAQLLVQYLMFDLKREQKREPFQAFYLLANPCNYWIAAKDIQSLSYLRYDREKLLESIRGVLR